MLTNADSDFSRSIVDAALLVAAENSAAAILAHVDAVPDPADLAARLPGQTKLILIARDADDERAAARHTEKTLLVPDFDLARMDQIKVATLIGFSRRLVAPGETFVFLVGPPHAPCDTVVIMRLGAEYEMFRTVDQPKLTEHVRRVVFERVLSIALELAHQGRESRPVGALFVLGNYRELEKYCTQTIINPFKGYPERERNILDAAMRETVKEFSSVDGAFVIKGNGAIVSAGTMLRPALAGDPLPQGLGARHAAAAAITASAPCIAVTISQSDGTVRVWRRGRMITEIEKPPRPALPA